MTFDSLFEQRSLVAEKLKECMRDYGFTKIAFSKKADISRPTLDKILNAQIDSKSTFDKHMHKILLILDMTVDDLLFYQSAPKEISAVYSQNAPKEYHMGDKAAKEYDVLMDVLDLCTIYY